MKRVAPILLVLLCVGIALSSWPVQMQQAMAPQLVGQISLSNLEEVKAADLKDNLARAEYFRAAAIRQYQLLDLIERGGVTVHGFEFVPTAQTLAAMKKQVADLRGISSRPDWMTARYANSYESLHVVELIKEPGTPGTYVVDPYLTGYLERVVIAAEGDDTQWSVKISDRAGGLLFEATDLDMTAGTASYDGQRIPFDGGLKIEVNNTTGADRFEIYCCYVWEVFTR